MRALFIGGSQNGVMLNIRPGADYYDFPVPMKVTLAVFSTQIPDTIQNFDVHRYKMTMISRDGESAIYTECGDALDVMTRTREFISDIDPQRAPMTKRKPQPVYLQPRKP